MKLRLLASSTSAHRGQQADTDEQEDERGTLPGPFVHEYDRDRQPGDAAEQQAQRSRAQLQQPCPPAQRTMSQKAT